MAQQYGLGNAFSDILNSYVGMKQTQQRNALAQQELEMRRQKMDADERYRNSVLNQQDRAFYEGVAEADRAAEQWKQTFDAEQKVRDSQIGVNNSRQEVNKAELAAAREEARLNAVTQGSKQLQNMTGGKSISQALQDGDMSQGNLDNWLRNFGGAFGVFDYKGETREYAGIEPLVGPDGSPTGEYTILLRNPATGTTGPMTDDGGTDGQEEVIRFDEQSLPALYQSIDNQFNAALNTGGRATFDQAATILNNNANAGDANRNITTVQDGYNSRGAIVASSLNARAGGTRGPSSALGAGDAGIRAINPLEAAESDRRNAALGMVDDALARPTVNRQLAGNELYTLNMLRNSGGLTDQQFGNAAVGDTIRGDVLNRSTQQLEVGRNMAQDATDNLINIQDKDATRAASAAESARNAARNARSDFDDAYSGVDEAVREVISVYSPGMEDGFAESQAQAFKTIVAKGYNDPASRDLYGSIISNPTVTRTVADSWSQLERARKQLNDGDFTGSEQGFWTNAFRTAFGPAYDITNPDMAQQHTDVAMLGAVAGQANMKAFLRDVILPVHNQSNRNIPPAAYRSAAQVIIRMNNARAERGEAPLSPRESKIMIQRHLLGKGGGAKEEPPVQAPSESTAREDGKKLTRRGLR